MQRLRLFCPLSSGGIRLDLIQAAASLTLDIGETTERRIQRLVSENPVVIFSRRSCCMCHVIKTLLFSVGAQPTVVELDEEEILTLSSAAGFSAILGGAPVVFVGGVWVGGVESLMALHLRSQLVPKLVEVGAITV